MKAITYRDAEHVALVKLINLRGSSILDGRWFTHKNPLTLKLGENNLLVLSLLALSTSSFFSVSTMVRLALGSWQTSGTDPLVDEVVLQLGTKNVLNQKWKSLSWNAQENRFDQGSDQHKKWNLQKLWGVTFFCKSYRISTAHFSQEILWGKGPNLFLSIQNRLLNASLSPTLQTYSLSLSVE